MTARQSHLVLWFTLPVVAVFLAATVAAKLLAAPPSARAASGLSCSVDSTTFYPLTNTVHPGWIGFQTAIGCNQYVAGMSVGSCLEKPDGFGGWILAGQDVCATKSSQQLKIAYSATLWYSCSGGITEHDSATYRGHSSYNVPGITPNIDAYTGVHGSRCLGPVLQQAG